MREDSDADVRTARIRLVELLDEFEQTAVEPVIAAAVEAFDERLERMERERKRAAVIKEEQLRARNCHGIGLSEYTGHQRDISMMRRVFRESVDKLRGCAVDIIGQQCAEYMCAEYAFIGVIDDLGFRAFGGLCVSVDMRGDQWTVRTEALESGRSRTGLLRRA